MAFTHLNLAISLLLLSSVAMASAGAYDSYDSSKSNYQSKPTEGKVNCAYAPSSDAYDGYDSSKSNYQPKPIEGEVNPAYAPSLDAYYSYDSSKSNYQPKPTEGEVNPAYAPSSDAYDSYDSSKYNYQPKPNEGEVNPAYAPSSDAYDSYDSSKYNYQPKPTEGEVNPAYTPSSDVYKPTPEESRLDYNNKPQGEGSYGYDKKPEVDQKSNYDKKLEGKKHTDYNAKLDVEVEVKPDYYTKQYNYQVKSERENSGYDKQETKEKPSYGITNYNKKPEVKEKPDYDKKPQEGEKHDYDKKPERENTLTYGRKVESTYQVKPEEGQYSYNKKPIVEGKPNYDQPENEEKPSYESPEVKNMLSIGVEGLVLCKSGSKYYPIPGALAKVTCQVEEYGVEKTLPICSVSTDAKGYFLATLSSLTNKPKKLKDCKAFLERSPLEICKVASDVNKGITGAPFSAYRVLHDKNMKLYSVGPFFFI